MMKNKLYVAGLILAATFASCADESNELVSHNATVAVSAEMGGQTRTSLGDESKTVTWSEGDQIYLFDTDGTSNGVMTLSEGAGETFATFRGSVNGKFVSLDKALYPVPTASGSEYTFDFPAERTWSENSAAPMIGDFSNNHVSFRNLAAMVRINLDGCSITDNSVLTLTMTGQAISGTATVDVDAETLSIGDGANNVNVSGLINAEFVDIPVPAGTYTGFSVTLDGTKIAEGTGSKELGKDDVVIVGAVTGDDEMTPEEDGSYLIESVADLYWFAEAVNNGNTFSGTTVKLAADINLANQQWIPISYKANDFQGTFDGNGYTISNLMYHSTEDDWYIGLFGGVKNATIKNLTINNVDIKCEKGMHFAALVGDAAGNTVIENVTIKGNVKIEGDITNEEVGRIGAVVGGNSGNFTLKNITVEANEGSYVKGNSSIGGIAGQLQGQATFEDCSSNINVEGYKFFAGGIIGLAPQNTTFTRCTTSGDVSIVSGRAGNANDLYRVGAIAGGWSDNGEYPLVLTDCSYTGTISGQDADGNVAEKLDCEGLVGRGYSANIGTKVIIDGVEYIYAGNGKYNVYGDGFCILSTIEALQAAVDAEGSDIKVTLGSDITGNLTVTQKPDVKVTIDGNGYTFAGVILVDGKSATYTTAGLTIKNLNFKAESISADACIRLGDGTNATRYTCNVTVEGCTFDVPNAVGVKSYTGGDKNLTIKGCTATTNAHSLIQAKGIDGVLIEGCYVYSKNGMNFNNSDNVTIQSTIADVRGYATRFGEGSSADSRAEIYSIKNCTLKSACEDGDAVIILRGTAANATLTIEDTTIEGTLEITNNAAGATVVK